MHLFIDREGNFYRRIPGDLERTLVPLPSPVTVRAAFKRTDSFNYRAKNMTVLVGQYSANLVWLTDTEQLVAMGITAATTAPTTAAGFSTGITANSIQYVYTFVQLVEGLVRVEGEESAPSIPLTVANKNIAVSGLPTSAASPRATHKRLYRSDNGGLYRFVAHIPLATATYNDTTATLALGAPIPQELGNPPLADMTELYHDRGWYVSHAHPDRAYYSEIGQPESVGELSYLQTRDGEPITGIARCGDELLLFGAHVSYRVLGYTAADYTVKKISPTIGCISNGSIVNINEVLFLASEQGPTTYDGSFKLIAEDIKYYWRDLYKLDPLSYQDSVGADDRFTHTYKLLIPGASSFSYVGHYDPVFKGGQADWVVDVQERKQTALGNLMPPGSFQTELHSGYCDNWVRRDNAPLNSNDDNDEDDHTVKIHTGAILFGDPGGNPQEGKKFTSFWSYVQSESVGWTFYALGGDSDVVNAALPNNTSATGGFKNDRDNSFSSGKTAPDTHFHGAAEQVSGRSLQIRVELPNAIGFKYRGFGGLYIDGVATRPAT